MKLNRPRMAILVFAFLSLLASPALAQKTDVVVMDNGNRLIAEVKKLEYGLLELSMTDIKGRVKVEWNHVVTLVSDKTLDIELRTGARFFGSLIDSEGPGRLRIQTPFGNFDVDRDDVVIIVPIKATFRSRLVGDVSTGVSFTKSTDILQFNFGSSASYRNEKSLTQLSLNTIITARSGGTKTNTDFPLTHQRFFKNKWFYRGDMGASRNDELGIDFRGNLAAGGGRRLVHSNSAIVRASMLISANREFTSDDKRTNNLELVLDTSLMAFRYDSPKLEVTVDADAFLNLTSWGRYRVSLDGRLSVELVEDLFWDIGQVYYRFDSDPSEVADSKSDWGIISGLRYKFD